MKLLRVVGAVLLSWWCSVSVAHAQGDSIDYRKSIQEVLEMIDEDEERELTGNRLHALADRPVDLNSATEEELSQIPFFDDFFIRNLLLYRSRSNGFGSIYDLKLVQGAPMSVLPLLEPFITIVQNPKADRPRTHSVFIGSESALGKNRGVGRPTSSLLVRYESIGKVSWHFAVENDRGEPLLPIREGLTDYHSLAVYGSRKAKGHQLSYVIGDYRVNTGQGLLLGQSFSYFSALSAGMGIPTLSRQVLKPHRSFREYGFLRGGALSIGTGHGWGLLLFAGYEPIDARIEDGQVKTLYPSTLHRTPEERRFRRTASRQAIGGYLSYELKDLHVGISTLRYRHRADGRTLLPPERYPQSKTIQQWSLDASYIGRHWQTFVESTLSPKERLGIQGGIRYFDDHFGSLTFQGRYFGEQRISPYGAADTYTSTGRDEKGIRLMWHGELALWTTGTLMIDHFDKLSTHHNTNTIVQARVMYNKGGTNAQGYLRFHHKENGDDRLSARATVRKDWTAFFGVRGGVQLNYIKQTPLAYTLFSRIMIGSPSGLRGEIGIQYFNAGKGLFRADAPYMPYHYYTPFLRGDGTQLIGALRYSITPQVQLQVRGSHTFYNRKKALPGTPNPSLLYLALAIKV